MGKRTRNWFAFNEYYFDSIDTPEKAYWLGFITADGCVRTGGGLHYVQIKLMESDAGHLEKLKLAVGSDRPLRFSVRRGVAGPSAMLGLSSPRLVEALARVGVGPRKSLTVEPWDGPADLMPHYWRGMFDGDGCICKPAAGKSWVVELCGSRPCIVAFAEWGRRICGSDADLISAPNLWRWKVGGVATPQALVRELYRDATVYLDRKYALAQQLLAQPVLTRSWRGQECTKDGCEAEAAVKGMCQTHYAANWRATADHPECIADDCSDAQMAHGYCTKHYQRDRKHGDPLRVDRAREGSRRYALNEAYFDEIGTEEQAYWLGFAVASASVIRSEKSNALRFEISDRDEDHLARLRDAIGSGKPLRRLARRESGLVTGSGLVAVSFDSWRLVESLGRVGMVPRKSVNAVPWNGPDHLMRHYWRGMVDGGGSVCKAATCTQWSIRLNGSPACVNGFVDWASAVCGATAVPRTGNSGRLTWTVAGTLKPQALAEALYGGAVVSLPRKQVLADELRAIDWPARRREACELRSERTREARAA